MPAFKKYISKKRILSQKSFQRIELNGLLWESNLKQDAFNLTNFPVRNMFI